MKQKILPFHAPKKAVPCTGTAFFCNIFAGLFSAPRESRRERKRADCSRNRRRFRHGVNQAAGAPDFAREGKFASELVAAFVVGDENRVGVEALAQIPVFHQNELVRRQILGGEYDFYFVHSRHGKGIRPNRPAVYERARVDYKVPDAGGRRELQAAPRRG